MSRARVYRSPMPARRAARSRFVAALTALIASASGTAGGRAQSLEFRAGLAVSSALAEDLIANPLLIADLGEAWTGSVTAEPAVGPTFSLVGATPLRPRSDLELAIGWTSTRLDAVDEAGSREIQDLSVGQATIGVRYRVLGPVEAACGFGVLRYFADGGLFEGGAGLSPLVECGGGARWGAAHRSVVLRATAQAHRFRTPVLRDAGAQSGSVLRLMIQAGIALGRRQ